MHELTGKRVEHFPSTPFPNAGFPDGILKYAFRAKSAASFEVKNGNTLRHTYRQGVYDPVSSNNVYSSLVTSRDQVSI